MRDAWEKKNVAAHNRGNMTYQIVAVIIGLSIATMVLFFVLDRRQQVLDDKNFIMDNSAIALLPEPSQNLDAIVMNDIEAIPTTYWPRFHADECTSMSSEELYDYYGINILSSIPDGLEEIGSLWPHGFYGKWDMNYFIFGEADTEVVCMEVRMAKTTKFVKPMLGVYGDDAVCSEIGGITMYLFRATYENKDQTEVALSAYFEYNGCDVEVFVPDVNSGCIDEDMLIGMLETLVTAQPK